MKNELALTHLKYDHLGRRVRQPPNECPVYDTKQFDSKTPALDQCRMESNISLPLFFDLFCPGVVVPDRVLSMGQINLFDI